MRESLVNLRVRCHFKRSDETNQSGERLEMNLRLQRCYGRRRGRYSLAARMLLGTHSAVASHLLAAGHLGLRHLWVGQAGKCGRSSPRKDQYKREQLP